MRAGSRRYRSPSGSAPHSTRRRTTAPETPGRRPRALGRQERARDRPRRSPPRVPRPPAGLFDRPATVAGHLPDEPAPAGRWRTEGGNFFEAGPPGGDFCLLKHILHDWDDEAALRVLGSVRRAAAPGARLLVVDAVLPGGGAPHPAGPEHPLAGTAGGSQAATTRAVPSSRSAGPAVEPDIVMPTVVEGREPTAAEFEKLPARAGFPLHRILPTPALPSVVEAVAV
ncbi:methyltransferase [Streptomyces sp. NPDC001389]|uniref:methyltransferase n=1 Tax=unclassified Streptomyces TaxID=2593676 RepID=UPI0036CC0E5B